MLVNQVSKKTTSRLTIAFSISTVCSFGMSWGLIASTEMASQAGETSRLAGEKKAVQQALDNADD
jgi:hypothetical protein